MVVTAPASPLRTTMNSMTSEALTKSPPEARLTAFLRNQDCRLRDRESYPNIPQETGDFRHYFVVLESWLEPPPPHGFSLARPVLGITSSFLNMTVCSGE